MIHLILEKRRLLVTKIVVLSAFWSEWIHCVFFHALLIGREAVVTVYIDLIIYSVQLRESPQALIHLLLFNSILHFILLMQIPVLILINIIVV